LRFIAYDAFGEPIKVTKGNPLTINIYGAPSGVISPTTATLTSGNIVTLAYNGQFFPNPITVEAYTANDGVGGRAIGVTQILARNKVACAYGTQGFTIPIDCGGEADPACSNDNITSGLKVIGAIGYNSPTAPEGLHDRHGIARCDRAAHGPRAKCDRSWGTRGKILR
jgi:hypothetical protein